MAVGGKYLVTGAAGTPAATLIQGRKRGGQWEETVRWEWRSWPLDGDVLAVKRNKGSTGREEAGH